MKCTWIKLNQFVYTRTISTVTWSSNDRVHILLPVGYQVQDALALGSAVQCQVQVESTSASPFKMTSTLSAFEAPSYTMHV